MTLSTIGYDDKRRRVEVSSLGFNGREMASDVGDELSVSPMKPPVTSSSVLNRSAEPPERDKKKLSRHVSLDLGSVGFGLKKESQRRVGDDRLTRKPCTSFMSQTLTWLTCSLGSHHLFF
ncbi:hypothetical protein YC2023_032800 [Brassica napus]